MDHLGYSRGWRSSLPFLSSSPPPARSVVDLLLSCTSTYTDWVFFVRLQGLGQIYTLEPMLLLFHGNNLKPESDALPTVPPCCRYTQTCTHWHELHSIMWAACYIIIVDLIFFSFFTIPLCMYVFYLYRYTSFFFFLTVWNNISLKLAYTWLPKSHLFSHLSYKDQNPSENPAVPGAVPSIACSLGI